MSQYNTVVISATLHVPRVFTTKKPWLGWNVVFDPSASASSIRLLKTHVELALNKYLEQNVDVVAAHLVIPFTNVLEATTDPLIYTFKIRVYVKSRRRKKVRFMYPDEPVKRIEDFILTTQADHGGSHTNTVTIKPPPH